MAFVSAVPLRSAQPRARQGVHGFCVTCSTKPLFDGTVYVVTDRKLAGPRGVLWAVEHALHGGGPGRRATAVQYVTRRVHMGHFTDSSRTGYVTKTRRTRNRLRWVKHYVPRPAVQVPC